jgi:hypothetical protein
VKQGVGGVIATLAKRVGILRRFLQTRYLSCVMFQRLFLTTHLAGSSRRLPTLLSAVSLLTRAEYTRVYASVGQETPLGETWPAIIPNSTNTVDQASTIGNAHSPALYKMIAM